MLRFSDKRRSCRIAFFSILSSWQWPHKGLKLECFDTVLAIRTHAAVTFFFLCRTCSCRLSSSLSSHLTPDQLVLSNTVLQLNEKKPSDSPVAIGDVAVQDKALAGSIQHPASMCTSDSGARSVDRVIMAFPEKRRQEAAPNDRGRRNKKVCVTTLESFELQRPRSLQRRSEILAAV